MSRRFRNIFLATAGSAVLAISAATFASANIPAIDFKGDAAGAPLADESDAAAIPAPVSAAPLFVSADNTGVCMLSDDVIAALDRDQAKIGGEVFRLADNLTQEFADSWRQQAGQAPVKVSGVIAHIFGHDGETAADVVEFDAKGCAMSRTILSGDDFATLINMGNGLAV